MSIKPYRQYAASRLLRVVSMCVRCVICVLCVAGGLLPSKLSAQTSSGQGRIDIQSATLSESSSGWQLGALADIQLSPEMRQGLNSGVPLQFIVDFRIKRNRAFWFDDTIFEHKHRLTLTYYELTRHYRLQSQSTGESGNYRSLLAALEKLGRMQSEIVQKPDGFDGDLFDSVEDREDGADEAGFDSKSQLYGQLSIHLDDKALPLPLRPLLSSTWKLASEEFAWSLN